MVRGYVAAVDTFFTVAQDIARVIADFTVPTK
jgi:hypothetical protein